MLNWGVTHSVASDLGWLLLAGCGRWLKRTCCLNVDVNWTRSTISVPPYFWRINSWMTNLSGFFFPKKLTHLFFTAGLVPNIGFPLTESLIPLNDVELPQTAPCAASFNKSETAFKCRTNMLLSCKKDVYSLAFHYLMDVLHHNKSKQSENFKIWQRA